MNAELPNDSQPLDDAATGAEEPDPEVRAEPSSGAGPEAQAPLAPAVNPGAPTPSPRRGCLARSGRWLGVALLLLAGWALFELVTWPDVAALADENPKSTAFIDGYRARQERQGGPELRWQPVPYSRISPHLKRAVLVSEDIGFFDHHGFATEELETALREAWREGKSPRGASTLTQQLAKNLWLSPSRNPWRKVKEALLTVQLERHLEKRRILELYLDVVEFGPGVYGAEAASRHYFGVGASELSPRQAAELAAGLPRPSDWHPGSASKVYQRRVARILGRMDKAQWLWKVI